MKQQTRHPKSQMTAKPSDASSRRGRIGLVSLVLVGVLVLLYPSTASWFSALNERQKVNDYVEQIESLPEGERAQALAQAETYNETMVEGLIVDPFSNTSMGEAVEIDAAALEYINQLSLDERGVMARVKIDKIDVDLPIFHGATDETLRKGVGHVYGSSLPVGGSGTHAVLTGHSGLPESTLFTNLFDLEVGDEFTVESYGRVMTYRVYSRDTIEPTDIENLGVVDGKDLVTLVTCTPIGINSHRFIIQAERVENPETVVAQTEASVPFPWWALGVAAALIFWIVNVLGAVRESRASHTSNRVRLPAHRPL